MDISEPQITREEIIILADGDFTNDNICIVTGASSGIGRATAVAAGANGLFVVGLDIDEKGGAETVRIVSEFDGRMEFVKTDLTVDDEVVGAIERAAQIGQVKYLANVAGIQHIDSVEDFPMEKYDLMQNIMLRAPFLLSKLSIPLMRRGGGGVIGNMTSVHAHICTINKPVYNITKFGLRGLTQSIASEGNGDIRAFSVSTGFVKTALALKQIPAQAKQRGITPEEVVADVMMGKSRTKEMMNPIEVGNLFVLGFSRFARCLIGGDLLLDGGMVLTY
jgi:3-hydroxybutyrate dehydrogenase